MKVLILGDGLLGSEIRKQTNWDFISRKTNTLDIKRIDLEKLNKYDIIINCIANTNTYSNEKEVHWDVNYKFVYDLISFCNSNNKKIIHISTDYVYSGSINNASEEDVPVHCNNWYGYTKLLSDGLIQLLSNNYLLIRCTHKPNPFPYEMAWIDQVGNFDYVDVISKMIVNLINKDSKGVYNVGTELKSIYNLASKSKSVIPILSPLETPKNTSMNLTKLINEN